jgi:tRNA pseudouridine13 synthase
VGEVGFEVLDAETVRLSFELPPGSYATVFLEQLGAFTSKSVPVQ